MHYDVSDGLWDVQDVACVGCRMIGMRDVCDVKDMEC